MLAGIVRGKVPVDLGLEDGLTAATLGSLRYLPPAFCLEWLSLARDRNGVQLAVPVAPRPWGESVCMWPRFELDEAGVEPDAVIELPAHWIIIEAKLWSGKSNVLEDAGSEGISDQLARQWVAVQRARERAGCSTGAQSLVFVTAHAVVPEHELAESEDAIVRAGAGAPRVFWVNWSALARVLRAARTHLSDERGTIVDDVLDYMGRALPGGALPFVGWDRSLRAPSGTPWRYRRPPRAWFRFGDSPGVWRYGSRKWFAALLRLDDQTINGWRYKKAAT